MANKKDNKIYWIIGIIVLFVLMSGKGFIGSTQLPDPSSVYCKEQGGIYTIGTCGACETFSEGYANKEYGILEYTFCCEKHGQGAQAGYCYINGEFIDSWEFYGEIECPQYTPQQPCDQRDYCKDGCTEIITSEAGIYNGCFKPAIFKCVPIEQKTCEDLGYSDGEYFNIQCNRCSCSQGDVICTLTSCPQCDGEWIEGKCEKIEPTGIACYYIEDDKCLWKEFKTTTCPDNYYSTKAKCEADLPTEEEETFFDKYGIYLIIGGIVLLFLKFNKD